MELLATRFVPVTLDQIRSFLDGSGSLPRRSVAVTFDDGYLFHAIATWAVSQQIFRVEYECARMAALFVRPAVVGVGMSGTSGGSLNF